MTQLNIDSFSKYILHPRGKIKSCSKPELILHDLKIEIYSVLC